MSFESMLSLKCDIHKIKKVPGTGMYGLPAQDTFSYSETADLSNVKCYYELTRGKSFGDVDRKDVPAPRVSLSIRIYFPMGTDVTISDLVKIEGEFYRLDLPKNVRNHHLEVFGSHYEAVFD